MSSLKRRLALSNHPLVQALRWAHRRVQRFSIPAPALAVRPLLAVFVAVRELYYFLVRVFVCEPLFKAYCTKFGRGLRTGVYVHWVSGGGRIIVGDDVLVDGKCSFRFAVRFVENPTLFIGDHTTISHGCSVTVGREVSIGRHCLIASGVRIFDSPGHPTDPVQRKLGKPPNPEDVRSVTIGDNVWVGADSIIFPGVTIGEGSVAAMGSLVTSDVPPNTIVAGNPARVIAHLSAGTRQESLGVHIGDKPLPDQPADERQSADTLRGVTELIQGLLGVERLELDEDFYEAGVTSIMVLPLMIELAERFGVTIPQVEFLDARTPRALSLQIAELIEAQRPPQPL
jgi:acetyltransferase-like isoleucine patch superfamily enzyme/acyl carrier protein